MTQKSSKLNIVTKTAGPNVCYDTDLTKSKDPYSQEFWYYQGDPLHNTDGPAYTDINGKNKYFVNGVEYSSLDAAKKRADHEWAINPTNKDREWTLVNNGMIHREDDKPAIEGFGGFNFEWRIRGKLHRENNKPAVIDYSENRYEYHLDGRLHRTDGPAIEFPNEPSKNKYYVHGSEYSSEKYFEQLGIIKKVVSGNIHFINSSNGLLHNPFGPAYIGADDYKAWQINGQYHRENGPAIEDPLYDSYAWYKNGKLHREDGPAIINSNGEGWYKNGIPIKTSFDGVVSTFDDTGLLHSLEGPAIVNKAGDYYYYKHGKLHREDGPAIVTDDERQFWMDDKQYTEREFYSRFDFSAVKDSSLYASLERADITLNNKWKIYQEDQLVLELTALDVYGEHCYTIIPNSTQSYGEFFITSGYGFAILDEIKKYGLDATCEKMGFKSLLKTEKLENKNPLTDIEHDVGPEPEENIEDGLTFSAEQIAQIIAEVDGSLSAIANGLDYNQRILNTFNDYFLRGSEKTVDFGDADIKMAAICGLISSLNTERTFKSYGISEIFENISSMRENKLLLIKSKKSKYSIFKAIRAIHNIDPSIDFIYQPKLEAVVAMVKDGLGPFDRKQFYEELAKVENQIYDSRKPIMKSPEKKKSDWGLPLVAIATAAFFGLAQGKKKTAPVTKNDEKKIVVDEKMYTYKR